jgi:hypothetical protein
MDKHLIILVLHAIPIVLLAQEVQIIVLLVCLLQLNIIFIQLAICAYLRVIVQLKHTPNLQHLLVQLVVQYALHVLELQQIVQHVWQLLLSIFSFLQHIRVFYQQVALQELMQIHQHLSVQLVIQVVLLALEAQIIV